MQIIKHKTIVEDSFQHVGEAEALPEGDVIVPLARWLIEKDKLRHREGKVGVRLGSDADPAILKEDLDDLAVIAVEFPTFMDGRGYSIARLLRGRYGYQGELRAVGDVMRDQMFYMQRCGFNAFEVKEGKDIRDALQGLDGFSVTYQASVDEKLPLYRRR
ncbi:DUF934 domain-containing protein [Luteithermobacter gelatinilyticus]|uniref:DUF934 domain-containing protein n=1 Tax=Luteithermobacter gelatinilyticus TaxID=2582913 RepID=UPI00110754C2|nr:DUF934 domain-containing protein [Luteithermobacter gelatinilyticus]